MIGLSLLWQSALGGGGSPYAIGAADWSFVGVESDGTEIELDVLALPDPPSGDAWAYVEIEYQGGATDILPPVEMSLLGKRTITTDLLAPRTARIRLVSVAGVEGPWSEWKTATPGLSEGAAVGHFGAQAGAVFAADGTTPASGVLPLDALLEAYTSEATDPVQLRTFTDTVEVNTLPGAEYELVCPDAFDGTETKIISIFADAERTDRMVLLSFNPITRVAYARAYDDQGEVIHSVSADLSAYTAMSSARFLVGVSDNGQAIYFRVETAAGNEVASLVIVGDNGLRRPRGWTIGDDELGSPTADPIDEYLTVNGVVIGALVRVRASDGAAVFIGEDAASVGSRKPCLAFYKMATVDASALATVANIFAPPRDVGELSGFGAADSNGSAVVITEPYGFEPHWRVRYTLDDGVTWKDFDDPAPGPGIGYLQPADVPAPDETVDVKIGAVDPATGAVITASKSDAISVPNPSSLAADYDVTNWPDASTLMTVQALDGALRVSPNTAAIASLWSDITLVVTRIVQPGGATQLGPVLGAPDQMLTITGLDNGSEYGVQFGFYGGAGDTLQRVVAGSDLWTDAVHGTPAYSGPATTPADAGLSAAAVFPSGYADEVSVEWGAIPPARASAITHSAWRFAPETRSTERSAYTEGEIGTWGAWNDVSPASEGDVTSIGAVAGRGYVQVTHKSAEGYGEPSVPYFVEPFSGTEPTQPVTAGRIYVTSQAEWRALEQDSRDPAVDLSGITEIHLVGDGTIWRGTSPVDAWADLAGTITVRQHPDALPARIAQLVIPGGDGWVFEGVHFQTPPRFVDTIQTAQEATIWVQSSGGGVTFTDCHVTHGLPRFRDTDGFSDIGNSVEAVRFDGDGCVWQSTEPATLADLAPSVERVFGGFAIQGASEVRRAWVRGCYDDGLRSSGAVTGATAKSVFISDTQGNNLRRHSDFWHLTGTPGGDDTQNALTNITMFGCGMFAGKETGRSPLYLSSTYDPTYLISADRQITLAELPGTAIVRPGDSAITVTLPDATASVGVSPSGVCIARSKSHSGKTGSVVIATTGADTVDGGATLTLTGDWEAVVLKPSAGAWTLDADALGLSLNGILSNANYSPVAEANGCRFAFNINALPMGQAFSMRNLDAVNTVIAYNVFLGVPDPLVHLPGTTSGIDIRTKTDDLTSGCAVSRNIFQSLGDDWVVPASDNYLALQPNATLATQIAAFEAQFDGLASGWDAETPAELIAMMTPASGADAAVVANSPHGKWDWVAADFGTVPVPALSSSYPAEGAVIPSGQMSISFNAPIAATGAGTVTVEEV